MQEFSFLEVALQYCSTSPANLTIALQLASDSATRAREQGDEVRAREYLDMALQAVTATEHFVHAEAPEFHSLIALNCYMPRGEWRQAIVKLRDAIIYCPQCSAENFYDINALKASGGDPGACWSCQSKLILPPRLKLGDEIVMLNYNTYLYPHHIDPDRRYDFS